MIDIVIPTYGANTRLKSTLEALIECNDVEKIKTIIVVENGEKFSAEDICKSIKKDINIKYVHSFKKGLVDARNTGIFHSTAQFIIFIDDDIEVEKNYLSAYFNAIEKYGKSCFYGGSLVPDYEEIPPKWLVCFLPWSAKVFSLGDEEKIVSEEKFLGGNLCIPREALLNAGNFEGLGAVGDNNGGVGEEMRLQQRLISLGLQPCWVPNARGKHWIPIEKCDRAFILQRHFRHGLTDAEADMKTYKTIASVPRWIYKSIAIDLVNLFLCTIRNGSSLEKFTIKTKIYYKKGLMYGYKSPKSKHA